MTGISTHILDLSRGVAAAGVAVRLERENPAGGWEAVSEHRTDGDGRVKDMIPEGGMLQAGVYRLRFETGVYWASNGVSGFHPVVEVTFSVVEADRHHHVPLLVSPFGYSTYRGT